MSLQAGDCRLWEELMVRCTQRRSIEAVAALPALVALGIPLTCSGDPVATSQDDGYRGIYCAVGHIGGEYVYKYSGGLGTCCARHKPFAVYCEKVNKS